jgi:peptidoglycan/xylan/chitin deacetylase (PgdA/CDA1 family)
VAVATLPAEEARRQMRAGAEVMAATLGERPRHFSYPYGSACAAGPRDFGIARELGFDTAVTTRPGVLYAEHADHLTALPRVSLNGDYQALRYLDVLLSGLPFFVMNRFGRLNVA